MQYRFTLQFNLSSSEDGFEDFVAIISLCRYAAVTILEQTSNRIITQIYSSNWTEDQSVRSMCPFHLIT